ncbi:MAG: cysteine--tRNA ligase [Syntrophomonadaceae bacterium]|nr:cysteine--tRNA ligase [Syntrophomonadaceae bacterium]
MQAFNTLTNKKEKFTTVQEGKAGMYVCGPTTYNYIHLGNARPLVIFDTIRRYLEYAGYQVAYIQNFTDVDDKIINRAREEGMDPMALAEKYILEYYKDADQLGVRRADAHPQVSRHIPEIIELVQRLINSGHAYQADQDVYFAVRSFTPYGKLSGRSLDELQAGARVEVDLRKQDPMDFALWKSAKPGEPSWPSPWGLGRPGWHIECSAMAQKYLGWEFDIHGGGSDLIFPHHENEIAQSEAASGRPFARYWLHNGFITVNQEKMSKSLGNFFLLRDILVKYPGDVVRFYLLSTHYRSPLDFDDQKLEMSKKALARLKATVNLIQETLKNPVPETASPSSAPELQKALQAVRDAFEQAMNDDFNTALAIAALFDLSREANSCINDSHFVLSEAKAQALAEAKSLFIQLGGQVLGILTGLEEKKDQPDQELVERLMDLIIDVRQQCRERKDWQMSDAIRDRLKELDIVLEDTPRGVRWKRSES